VQTNYCLQPEMTGNQLEGARFGFDDCLYHGSVLAKGMGKDLVCNNVTDSTGSERALRTALASTRRHGSTYEAWQCLR
jgi:hypothetical protein